MADNLIFYFAMFWFYIGYLQASSKFIHHRKRGWGNKNCKLAMIILILVTLKLRNMIAYFFLRKKIHHVRPDGLIRPCALIDFRIVSFEQECTMYERVSSSHLNWSILWRCGWCKARMFKMG